MNNNQKIKATDCNTLKVPKSYGIQFPMESLSQMLFGLKVLFPILALLQMILFATALVFVKHTVVYTLFIMSLVSSLVLVFSSLVFIFTIYFSIRFRSFLFIFNTLFIILSFIVSFIFLFFSQALHLLAFGF